MVPHAPEIQRALLFLTLLHPLRQFLLHLTADGIISLVRTVDDDLRPLIPPPDEILAVKVIDIFSGTDIDIILVPAFLQHLHQPPGVAERVEIDCGDRDFPEFVVEVQSSPQDLAEHGFPRRHIAVRL